MGSHRGGGSAGGTDHILVGLIANVFLLGPLGYTLATALFFPVASRIMGSNKLLRDFVIGLALALIVYLVFTRPLSLGLLLVATFASILPDLPGLIARLRGQTPLAGRMVLGEGKED